MYSPELMNVKGWQGPVKLSTGAELNLHHSQTREAREMFSHRYGRAADSSIGFLEVRLPQGAFATDPTTTGALDLANQPLMFLINVDEKGQIANKKLFSLIEAIKPGTNNTYENFKAIQALKRMAQNTIARQSTMAYNLKPGTMIMQATQEVLKAKGIVGARASRLIETKALFSSSPTLPLGDKKFYNLLFKDSYQDFNPSKGRIPAFMNRPVTYQPLSYTVNGQAHNLGRFVGTVAMGAEAIDDDKDLYKTLNLELAHSDKRFVTTSGRKYPQLSYITPLLQDVIDTSGNKLTLEQVHRKALSNMYGSSLFDVNRDLALMTAVNRDNAKRIIGGTGRLLADNYKTTSLEVGRQKALEDLIGDLSHTIGITSIKLSTEETAEFMKKMDSLPPEERLFGLFEAVTESMLRRKEVGSGARKQLEEGAIQYAARGRAGALDNPSLREVEAMVAGFNPTAMRTLGYDLSTASQGEKARFVELLTEAKRKGSGPAEAMLQMRGFLETAGESGTGTGAQLNIIDPVRFAKTQRSTKVIRSNVEIPEAVAGEKTLFERLKGAGWLESSTVASANESGVNAIALQFFQAPGKRLSIGDRTDIAWSTAGNILEDFTVVQGGMVNTGPAIKTLSAEELLDTVFRNTPSLKEGLFIKDPLAKGESRIIGETTGYMARSFIAKQSTQAREHIASIAETLNLTSEQVLATAKYGTSEEWSSIVRSYDIAVKDKVLGRSVLSQIAKGFQESINQVGGEIRPGQYVREAAGWLQPTFAESVLDLMSAQTPFFTGLSAKTDAPVLTRELGNIWKERLNPHLDQILPNYRTGISMSLIDASTGRSPLGIGVKLMGGGVFEENAVNFGKSDTRFGKALRLGAGGEKLKAKIALMDIDPHQFAKIHLEIAKIVGADIPNEAQAMDSIISRFYGGSQGYLETSNRNVAKAVEAPTQELVFGSPNFAQRLAQNAYEQGYRRLETIDGKPTSLIASVNSTTLKNVMTFLEQGDVALHLADEEGNIVESNIDLISAYSHQVNRGTSGIAISKSVIQNVNGDMRSSIRDRMNKQAELAIQASEIEKAVDTAKANGQEKLANSLDRQRSIITQQMVTEESNILHDYAQATGNRRLVAEYQGKFHPIGELGAIPTYTEDIYHGMTSSETLSGTPQDITPAIKSLEDSFFKSLPNGPMEEGTRSFTEYRTELEGITRQVADLVSKIVPTSEAEVRSIISSNLSNFANQQFDTPSMIVEESLKTHEFLSFSINPGSAATFAAKEAVTNSASQVSENLASHAVNAAEGVFKRNASTELGAALKGAAETFLDIFKKL